MNEPARRSTRRRTATGRLARVGAAAFLVAGGLAVFGGHRAAVAAGGPGGEFFPVTPKRVLDTRIGLGAPQAFLDNAQTIDVKVTGFADIGVPDTGVLAVALNVTVTNTRVGGFVTVFPAGSGRPLASNLNVAFGGQTTANLVVVGVGAGGKVSVYTKSGTDVVFDIVGWYASDSAGVGAGQGSRLEPVAPQRILDSRAGPGNVAQLRAGTVTHVPVAGRITDRSGSVVKTVTGVVFNLTGVNGGGNGFVTAYPSGEGRPGSSNLNMTPGIIKPNLVMVKVGSDGAFDLYNQAPTDLIVDVVGYYHNGVDAGTFRGRVVPLSSPYRAFDTRNSGTRIGPDQIDTWDFTPMINSLQAGGAPAGNVAGIIANLTATQETADGYFTAYPADVGRPVASNLNLTRNTDLANLAVVSLSGGSAPNHLTTYNQSGFVHYLADVSAVVLAD